MKIPLIAVSYGEFAKTKRLFSYSEFGKTKLPVFTNAVTAALFVNSAKSAMVEHLRDKPPLMVQVCNNRQMAIDMFKVIGSVCPGIMIELNPRPLTEEALVKLHQSGELEDSVVLAVDEAIERLEASNGE